MSLFVHFIDVGQGNMILLLFPDGKIVCYDCNIHDENKDEIFKYLKKIMPKEEIDIFINSHRDSDHMRGLKLLHENYTINTLWDNGVSANTEAPEYEEYMELRRKIGFSEIESNQCWTHNKNVRIINGKRRDLNCQNAQSIVLHINHNGTSLLLTGDTDAKVWKDYIMKESKEKISCDILLASHHGSKTFIDDERDEKYYYTKHLQEIKPDITIISVGNNPHGHPHEDSIKYYEKYSNGSDKKNKIFRTDEKGHIVVELKGEGKWSLN